MTADELATLLRVALPSTGDVRMECIDVQRKPGMGLVATLRLLSYDAHGIRDVKEQEIVVVGRDQCDDSRIAVYVAAWGASLARAFQRGGIARFETLMPYDLAFPRLLELKRAATQADFEKAFGAKSRLG